jgi:hypothetical protein
MSLPTLEDVRLDLVSVRADVMEQIQHVRSPRRSTRYRTLRGLVVAGAAAILLAGAAIAVAQYDQQTIRSNATCFREASLGSQGVGIVQVPDASNPDAVADPIQACAVIWQNDMWDSSNNGDPDDPSDGTAPVPQLVACTLSDGVPGVFPREGSTASDEDFCGALGLADWGSD